MIFSPSLCRAARALLAWKQDDLASASGVAKRTILKYEIGAQNPYPRTLRDLVKAFETAGIVFTDAVDGEREAGVAEKMQLVSKESDDGLGRRR